MYKEMLKEYYEGVKGEGNIAMTSQLLHDAIIYYSGESSSLFKLNSLGKKNFLQGVPLDCSTGGDKIMIESLRTYDYNWTAFSKASCSEYEVSIQDVSDALTCITTSKVESVALILIICNNSRFTINLYGHRHNHRNSRKGLFRGFFAKSARD